MKFLQPIIIVLYLLANGPCLSQLRAQSDATNKPLLFYFDDDKKQWLKVSSYAQFWARHSQNNPGSTINDNLALHTTDLSIRRFRLGISTEPWENTIFFFQLGVNNLNYLSSRGTSVDVLDGYVEHKFSNYIAIGGGKSAWNGLSRFAAPSTSKLMTYDVTYISLPTLNDTDDLIRKLSVYAKGKFKSIDYRIVISKPLAVVKSSSFSAEPLEGVAKFTDSKSYLQYSGYLKYEILDSESNGTPFHGGTYLGQKNIFNLGVGYTFQNQALWSMSNNELKYHSLRLLAADLFLDLPLHSDRKVIFTNYIAYFNYNFGTNYLRQIGGNNTVEGLQVSELFYSQKGNSYPVLGTGEAFLGQVGVLLPKMGKNKKLGRLQPYFSGQRSHFEALPSPIVQFDLGLNYYLKNHSSKFTFNAQNRPIFQNSASGPFENGRKWMFVLQYQYRID